MSRPSLEELEDLRAHADLVLRDGVENWSSVAEGLIRDMPALLEEVARVRGRDPKAVDLVGPQEIAERLGVSRGTVRTWRWRGTGQPMPTPEWIISGVPIWRWPTVKRWAEETGRLSR